MNGRIFSLLTALRNGIEQNYVQMGLIASGNFGRELELVINKNSAQILAPRYVGAMESGRRPGGFPPLAVIRQWIIDKNRQGANIPESAAFPIARKIAQQGIVVPNEFNDGGVVSTIITQERIDSMKDEVVNIIRSEILDVLNL